MTKSLGHNFFNSLPYIYSIPLTHIYGVSRTFFKLHRKRKKDWAASVLLFIFLFWIMSCRIFSMPHFSSRAQQVAFAYSEQDRILVSWAQMPFQPGVRNHTVTEKLKSQHCQSCPVAGARYCATKWGNKDEERAHLWSACSWNKLESFLLHLIKELWRIATVCHAFGGLALCPKAHTYHFHSHLVQWINCYAHYIDGGLAGQTVSSKLIPTGQWYSKIQNWACLPLKSTPLAIP